MTEDTIVKVLNNTESYYGRCAGCCLLHKCFVTYKQITRRRCIEKNCKHFRPRGGSV